MSQKKAQLLNPLNGNLNVTGVVTASSFVGGLTGTATTATNAQGLSGSPDITITNVTGAAATFSGNVTIGGTLTYQDVENIDSVGIITAQQGIQVLANGLDVTGVGTFKSDVSIADKIIHTGDTDTAIRFPDADTFTIETGGTEAFRVASDQKVYFGDFASAGSKAYIEKEVSGDYKLNIHASSSTSQNRIITFNSREDVEALRIDASGRLLVGTSTSRAQAGINLPVFVENTDYSGIGICYNANNTVGSFLILSKSRGTGIGSNTIVQNGDKIGDIQFSAADGTDLGSRAASIGAFVDGAPGANDMPGRIEFHTTSDGSETPTERMRIDSSGRLLLGTDIEGRGGADELTIATSGDTGMTIRTGTNSTAAIYFSDATTGNAEFDGFITYNQADRFMQFGTAQTNRLRITSTGGVDFNNAELIERVNITSGKLSDNQNINLENGMAHLFTTTETTTATPNIMTNTGINTHMAVGDVISVNIITTAAAAGYAATVHIDGVTVGTNGGSLVWNGGSAPSEGGSSGNDFYSYSIIKTASATYTVLANVTNFA